ncbi:MAG: bifunctional DNA-formamidopyrimidine glycosylase/DNA-(apurinic or apyrimidinic site) lyase [Candidatus Omnitrophota bacterium]
MPELPEVETIKRDLAKHISGASIEKVSVIDPRVIRNHSPKILIDQCSGRTIARVSRRGKALIVSFSQQGHLVIQPMMTGQLVLLNEPAAKPPRKETKIIFKLSNGRCLIYNDQRLFGRVQYVGSLRESKFLTALGAEPLSEKFNCRWLRQGLSTRKGKIKPALMDQRFIAGIGNIYASEILFCSGIHPQRRADTLRQKEIAVLHKATVQILRKAIRFRGTSIRDYRDGSGQRGEFIGHLKVYGREKQRCSRCDAKIRRVVQSGRSTFYCPTCQR